MKKMGGFVGLSEKREGLKEGLWLFDQYLTLGMGMWLTTVQTGV